MEPSFASPFSKGGSRGILIGYILSENQNPPLAALWEGGKYEKYCVCDTVSKDGVQKSLEKSWIPAVPRLAGLPEWRSAVHNHTRRSKRTLGSPCFLQIFEVDLFGK